jgi:streptogramin lyase
MRSRHLGRIRVALAGLTGLSLLAFGAPASGAIPQAAAAARPDVRIGGVTYFFVPSLHSRPWRITPGPDGNLWFTDMDADLIGNITTSGVITEYPIGEGKRPYDIVAGRDGNIWFTENVNNKAGAVDLNGNLVHEYYAPGTDARPTGITVAPNGDIWWMDGGSGLDPENNVSHLLPDGTVVNHELYPCACFGIGLTVGADGNLWGVEELGVFDGEAKGTIDRITPDPVQVDRFPIPAPPFTEMHLPGWIAPGPDGNLWFTEFNFNLHQVGMVTTDGVITEYALPGEDSNTGGVTTGIDGRIWVTEPDANRISILKTDGSFLNSVAVHQQPTAITIGPDGNMWFTNSLSGEIGRIRTAKPGVGYVLDIAPGFVPVDRRISLGNTVQWVLEAPGLHQVQDATGLGLFDSGLLPPVSFHKHVFRAAGTYAYVDPPTGDSGTIGVPVDAPAKGRIGEPFRVSWATVSPSQGLVFDAQYLPPGADSWVTWKSGVTTKSGSFTPTAPGTYQFRALIRRDDGSAGTDWSPPESVLVT